MSIFPKVPGFERMLVKSFGAEFIIALEPSAHAWPDFIDAAAGGCEIRAGYSGRLSNILAGIVPGRETWLRIDSKRGATNVTGMTSSLGHLA